MRFGSHLSVAGGVANAVREAVELGLDALQIFTANQRQWSPRSPSDEEIKDWFAALKEAGWSDVDDVRVVSHNSYLVNLASPDAAARMKSLELQRHELERCEALAVRRCVMHPGAHLGTPAPRVAPPGRPDACTEEERAGLERLAKSLDALHTSTAGFKVLTCLENTAGAGTTLGYDLRQLAIVRDMMKTPERIGFCFDTCHATAAGYDMHTAAGAQQTLELLCEVLGIARHSSSAQGGATPRVRESRTVERRAGDRPAAVAHDTRSASRFMVFHLNDSKGALASRLDRHEHINDGVCGAQCFRMLLTAPEFEACPGILETPKEDSFNGTPWDIENVRRLRAIAGEKVKPPTPARVATLGKTTLLTRKDKAPRTNRAPRR